ncbi:phage infection protein, partial [Chloroflexota bacterium]
QDDLDHIYTSVFGTNGNSAEGKNTMIDIIHHEANECLNAEDGINFENKIVLSIAIRIAAEKFMVDKIKDPAFVASINVNQTPKLQAKFKELFSSDQHAIETIQRVILMTPDNIHMNSFMYEPILDMAEDHLKKLYKDVLALT